MHASDPEARDHQAGRSNFLQQQAKFDDFVECSNNERPHQALNMRCPAECYVPSARPYAGLPEFDYPFHDRTITVTTCGRICFNRQKINLSTVFAGQKVGIKQVSEQIWLVSFTDYDLSYFDDETCWLEPLENPFGPKVLGPVVTSDSSVMLAKPLAKRAPHSAVASERLRWHPSMTGHHQSVTYVSGINRNPCVRNGPGIVGSGGGTRTPDPRIMIPVL
jgi:hypothetical protein